MAWLAKNGPAIQSIAAIITAIVAVGALIDVKIQLDEADRLQNLQSAREAYRSHLVLAVANPDFAEPKNACELLSSNKAAAYEAFVDHLLYSAEQMLALEDDRETTFASELAPHAVYLCGNQSPIENTQKILKLMSETIVPKFCEITKPCDR